MSERVKVNVKVSSEVNTILHDLFNQIQYELCEQYEDEIERLNNIIKEVREYIEENLCYSNCDGMKYTIPSGKDILEILNKGDD